MSDSITSEKSSKGNSSQPAGGNPSSSGSKPAKKPVVRIDIEDIVKGIRRLDHHFAKSRDGSLYHYEHGVYRPGGEEAIEEVVADLFETVWNRFNEYAGHYATEAIRYFKAKSPRLWEPEEINPDVINTKNGLLDVSGDFPELSGHSPRYLSQVQIPVDYDPSAECPAWEKFLSEVWPKDSMDMAWEVFAWMMTPWNAIQQAVILCGTGRNGKGRFIAGLTAFIGPDNVTTKSLDEIEGDRFSRAALYGMLGNICADIKGGRLVSSGAFKLITGGDRLTGEEKFKPPFQFKPFVKLLFSLNDPFKSDDTSYGFMRRLLGVPFPNKFLEGGTDEDLHKLDARLAAPGELSGVLNRALMEMPRLREYRRFHYGPSVEEATRELRREVDPNRGIIEPIFEDNPSRHVPCWKAYDEVKKAFLAAGHPVPTLQAFGRIMQKVFPHIRLGSRRDPEDEYRSKRVYCGIGWAIPTKDGQ